MHEHVTATEIRLSMEATKEKVEKYLKICRENYYNEIHSILCSILMAAQRREVIKVLKARIEQIATSGNPTNNL